MKTTIARLLNKKDLQRLKIHSNTQIIKSGRTPDKVFRTVYQQGGAKV